MPASRQIRDSVRLPPRRAGGFAGTGIPRPSRERASTKASSRARAFPAGEAGHAGDGRVQPGELGPRGEQVAGGGAGRRTRRLVSSGAITSSGMRGVVFSCSGIRPATWFAVRPSHGMNVSLSVRNGPCAAMCLTTPALPAAATAEGAPPGEHACQQGGRDVGQPGCPGCREVGQDGPDLMELRGQVRDLHGPGGRAADRDRPVDPGVQEFLGGSPLAGIGDGGEVDPAAFWWSRARTR